VSSPAPYAPPPQQGPGPGPAGAAGRREPGDGVGLRYHELLRLAPRTGWWVLLGVVAVVLLVLVGQVLALLPVAIAYAARGYDAEQVTDRLSGDPATPGFLLSVNAGWLLAIVAVLLVVRLVHGLGFGWATSVVARFRWRWFLVCAALALVALLATVLVSMLVPADDGVGGSINSFTSETRDYLLVILLLTPFQAAGEEYAFRGYLMQAIGSMRWRKVATYAAVLVSALVFALAHGLGQGAPVFIDRFAFGIVAAVLVIRTGGLEAGIAMHVLNNWLAFGLALAFGDMTESLNASGGSWWNLLVTATQSVVFVGLVLLAARRMGISERTGAEAVTVLERQESRV
jgi:membrane protease YdiL (CAAX protease family)